MRQKIANLTKIMVAASFIYGPVCHARENIFDKNNEPLQVFPVEHNETRLASVALPDFRQDVIPEQLPKVEPALEIDPNVLDGEILLTPEESGITAAVADGATTMLALSSGALETNPLISTSPLGLIALTGMKIGWVKYSATLPESEKRLALQSSSAIWGGAAVNNLLVLLAVPTPLSIVAGLVMGLATWNYVEGQYIREDRLLAERKKKILDANEALVSKLDMQGKLDNQEEIVTNLDNKKEMVPSLDDRGQLEPILKSLEK